MIPLGERFELKSRGSAVEFFADCCIQLLTDSGFRPSNSPDLHALLVGAAIDLLLAVPRMATTSDQLTINIRSSRGSFSLSAEVANAGMLNLPGVGLIRELAEQFNVSELRLSAMFSETSVRNGLGRIAPEYFE